MEWAESFYAMQDELSGVYTGALHPQQQDRERAELVTTHLSSPPGVVLELGAGGGLSALATAQRGHNVTAVELVTHAAAHARRLIPNATPGTLRVIEGTFYTVELPEQFDVVCYWDGFGIGTDEDQQTLLRRIAAWLKPSGIALIDINTPWYWAQAAGQRMTTSTFVREYGFDADGCRMLDHWWPPQHEDQRVTQSLRCYSPQDLRLLLKGTGLILERLVPGGAVDYEAHSYTSNVSLERAMQYCAHLRRE
ncbi:MAG TPA: methyltransferase domain-containing protein [Ktedonobacterales bacterium]